MTSGFVETFGVGVCAGGYSPALCREWHRWDKEHGSENEPVDVFKGRPDQLFVVGGWGWDRREGHGWAGGGACEGGEPARREAPVLLPPAGVCGGGWRRGPGAL